MKKLKLESSNTSGYDSSTIQIDVTASASNSTYNMPIEKRVIKVDTETR